MNDKYAKEIAKELRLIRRALQGNNQAIDEGVQKELNHFVDNHVAGERVTIK